MNCTAYKVYLNKAATKKIQIAHSQVWGTVILKSLGYLKA